MAQEPRIYFNILYLYHALRKEPMHEIKLSLTCKTGHNKSRLHNFYHLKNQPKRFLKDYGQNYTKEIGANDIILVDKVCLSHSIQISTTHG